MTVHEITTESSRASLARSAVVLSDRAAALRDTPATTHPLIAGAYRRRAAELELAAWVGVVTAGIPPESAHIREDDVA